LGSTAQIGRTSGLRVGLANNPTWSLVARESGEFTQAKSQELMESFISLDFNLIFAENDNMAYGAIDVLKEAGFVPGEDVTVVSFDATRGGLEMTLAGEISFNAECNPLHGPRVQTIIEQLEAGETPQKFTYVEEVAFSADDLTKEIITQRAY
jgi:simple sugar transport system substrate-binding protein